MRSAMRPAMRPAMVPAALQRALLPSASINYATTWPFAADGLVGPWANLTRTGLATLIDSAGNVAYTPHNLLLRSDEQENAAYWEAIGLVSRSSDTTTAVIDGVRCTRVDYAAGTNYSFTRRSLSVRAGQTYTLSLRIHSSSTHRYVSLRCANKGGAVNFANFDRQAGAWISSGSGIEAVTLNPTVDLGGGWIRISITSAPDATETRYFSFGAALVGNSSEFIANASATTLVVQRMRLQEGLDSGAADDAAVRATSAAVYLPRITHNPTTLARLGLLIEGQATQLLPKTDNFADAAWNKVGPTTVTTDGAGVSKITEDGSVSSFATFISAGLTIGEQYTMQVKAKAGERSWLYIRVDDDVTIKSAFYNLTTGELGAASAGVTSRIEPLEDGEFLCTFTRTIAEAIVYPCFGVSSADNTRVYTGTAGHGIFVRNAQLEPGSVATSYTPNHGTGSMVRVSDHSTLSVTGSSLSAAFPGGVTAPFTVVVKYRKGYSRAADETLFALSAGSSASGTNLLALQTNGTQAKLAHSGGDGAATGTLVHDGATVNKVAVSVDPGAAKMSIAVNGAAAVETTGIAYTGSGTTHLIPGAQTTGGTEAIAQFVLDTWDSSRTTYITGAALQALSAL